MLILSLGVVSAENMTEGDGTDVNDETVTDDADDSSQNQEDDEETDVEFDLDVIYDEDDGNASENSSSSKPQHGISLTQYATSNPILLALLVGVITLVIPLRKY